MNNQTDFNDARGNGMIFTQGFACAVFLFVYLHKIYGRKYQEEEVIEALPTYEESIVNNQDNNLEQSPPPYQENYSNDTQLIENTQPNLQQNNVQLQQNNV